MRKHARLEGRSYELQDALGGRLREAKEETQ